MLATIIVLVFIHMYLDEDGGCFNAIYIQAHNYVI